MSSPGFWRDRPTFVTGATGLVGSWLVRRLLEACRRSPSVRQILAAMGSRLKPEIRNEAQNEIREQYLSAARARSELGWTPRFSLQQGLERTIAWYREFLQQPTRVSP
jgi:nucleoside-diphosphate-sugar epimerase